jgi:very-short-patch-repair endonuclease
MGKPIYEIAFQRELQKISDLVPEHKFHPTRRWRFDYAYPVVKLAIEVEGGIYSYGRHTRGKGYTEDCRKYNAAILEGWKVIRFTQEMLRNEFDDCINIVKQAISSLEHH